jgi:hypothetical protein
LLLKLSTKYPKYGIGGSLHECTPDEYDISSSTTSIRSANAMACAVAHSRNKSAVLRVGGGELFDEAYRAVSFDWNSVHPGKRKYHLVGGGAGTVSAAGGWLQSGGLSGTTGMVRFFLVGIVLALVCSLLAAFSALLLGWCCCCLALLGLCLHTGMKTRQTNDSPLPLAKSIYAASVRSRH